MHAERFKCTADTVLRKENQCNKTINQSNMRRSVSILIPSYACDAFINCVKEFKELHPAMYFKAISSEYAEDLSGCNGASWYYQIEFESDKTLFLFGLICYPVFSKLNIPAYQIKQ